MTVDARDYVLSIDQGTTGTTALVFDRGGRIKGRAYSEITQHYPQPARVEHNPEEIWERSRGGAGEALQAARVEASRLAALGVTNQRETGVLWERATGRAVAPAVVWQDRRTANICDEMRARGLE